VAAGPSDGAAAGLWERTPGTDETRIREFSTPVEDRLQPGKRLGRYRLGRRLDTHSPKTPVYVFSATRIQDGEDFALKIYELSRLSKSRTAQVGHEIEIGERLRGNPFVLGLEDDYVRDGFMVLVFELMEKTLRHVVEGEPRPDETMLATWIQQVARGLDAMHGIGWLHLDVKPENCFIDPAGRALIGDMGIAWNRASSPRKTEERKWGTSPYMAPEHREGHPTRASDQYSLGLVSWELFTGSRFPREHEPLSEQARSPINRSLSRGGDEDAQPYSTPSEFADDLLGAVLSRRQERNEPRSTMAAVKEAAGKAAEQLSVQDLSSSPPTVGVPPYRNAVAIAGIGLVLIAWLGVALDRLDTNAVAPGGLLVAVALAGIVPRSKNRCTQFGPRRWYLAVTVLVLATISALILSALALDGIDLAPRSVAFAGVALIVLTAPILLKLSAEEGDTRLQRWSDLWYGTALSTVAALVLVVAGSALVDAADRTANPRASDRPVEFGGAINKEVQRACLQECFPLINSTGFGELGDRQPYRVSRDAAITGWTVSLGKADADLENRLGDPRARIVILERVADPTEDKYRIRGATRLVDLNPYLGTTVSFIVRRPILARRGDQVALSVPSWAPVFSPDHGRHVRWATGDAKCKDRHQGRPAHRLGSIRTYGCRYWGNQPMYSVHAMEPR
jgi:hypothetical protein